MKKSVVVLLMMFLVFLMPCVMAAPDLSVISGGYSPSPAKIGSSFDLIIDIENIGTTIASDVACSLSSKYTFSISGGDLERYIGSINPGETKTSEYTIGVYSSASAGAHTIIVECEEQSGYKVTKDLIINVESKYGTLNINDVRTDPPIIEPGQKAVLYMTLDNKADYLMNEINVKLDFSEVEIAPYGESGEKKIKSISALSSEDLSFEIVALPSIAGGIYKIPINLSYKDVTTKSYEVSNYVSVEVGSEPEIDITIDSSTIYGSKKTGEVIIKLVNRGLTDIKLLNVMLDEGKGFEILSSQNVYIGDLDSDDYETADFDIKLGRWRGEVVLPLILEFRDSSNNLYTQQRNITFKKLSASEAGESSISIWLILIVLAIAGYFYYRYRKRKKVK